MKIIVFAATKGGTGKTTLAFNVAIEAARHGSVFVVDMDPQGSLTNLCEKRTGSDNPMLLEDVKIVSDAIRRLRETGFERDYMIVDTPGSMTEIIHDAIDSAHCVVLPVQASLLDLDAQEDVAAMVKHHGQTKHALFVLNRVDNRLALTSQALKRLASILPSKPVSIKQRAAYVQGANDGVIGPELNKDAAKEIGALWKSIIKTSRSVKYGKA